MIDLTDCARYMATHTIDHDGGFLSAAGGAALLDAPRPLAATAARNACVHAPNKQTRGNGPEATRAV